MAYIVSYTYDAAYVSPNDEVILPSPLLLSGTCGLAIVLFLTLASGLLNSALDRLSETDISIGSLTSALSNSKMLRTILENQCLKESVDPSSIRSYPVRSIESPDSNSTGDEHDSPFRFSSVENTLDIFPTSDFLDPSFDPFFEPSTMESPFSSSSRDSSVNDTNTEDPPFYCGSIFLYEVSHFARSPNTILSVYIDPKSELHIRGDRLLFNQSIFHLCKVAVDKNVPVVRPMLVAPRSHEVVKIGCGECQKDTFVNNCHFLCFRRAHRNGRFVYCFDR